MEKAALQQFVRQEVRKEIERFSGIKNNVCKEKEEENRGEF